MTAAVEPSSRDPRGGRRRRMGILALADTGELKRLWQRLGLDPAHEALRGPETGLVTLRGRTGGGGAPFNVGEASVTRATVRLEDGSIGHSIMLGRDKVKARLAAVIDALAVHPDHADRIEAEVLAPLEAAQAEADRQLREETAATRVEFFTMVRGED